VQAGCVRTRTGGVSGPPQRFAALRPQFSFELREDLGLTSDKLKSAVRRNLVDYANQHWAAKLARGLAVERAVSIQHCDQTSKKDCAPLENVSVARAGAAPALAEGDVMVLVNPGPAEQWKSGARPAGPGNTLIYLNSISGRSCARVVLPRKALSPPAAAAESAPSPRRLDVRARRP
jgi:hypothetical protein